MPRCRSCPAPVHWLRNEDTGKSAPIDRDPTPDGNIVVNLAEGTYRALGPEARVEFRARGVELRKNHFATCPDRATWKDRARSGNRL